MVRPWSSFFSTTKVLIGKGGDLRQMRYAQHLLRAAQRLQLLTNGISRAATNADVDFIEDERARRGQFLSWIWTQLSSTATFSASITRDISPPEAISCSGFSGSPGFVAMRYSTSSQPCAVHA